MWRLQLPNPAIISQTPNFNPQFGLTYPPSLPTSSSIPIRTLSRPARSSRLVRLVWLHLHLQLLSSSHSSYTLVYDRSIAAHTPVLCQTVPHPVLPNPSFTGVVE